MIPALLCVLFVLGWLANKAKDDSASTQLTSRTAANHSSTELSANTAEMRAAKEPKIMDILVQQNAVFPPRSYAVGELPKGLYAFISEKGGYFAEELNGEILDNQNFASFGYVYVHGIGNVETQGYLVPLKNLKAAGFDSPKLLYEATTNQQNYKFSGYYKIGVDIPPGTYKLTSAGEGYMSINDGPVGKSSILDNGLFNGTKTVSVRSGEYLELSRAAFEKIK